MVNDILVISTAENIDYDTESKFERTMIAVWYTLKGRETVGNVGGAGR